MSAFQTTYEFFSWCTHDYITGRKTPFPFPTKDVELADLQVGDVFTTYYGYETTDGYHLKKVIKKNKKTITVQPCTSRGRDAGAVERLPLQRWAYHVIDFYAQ